MTTCNPIPKHGPPGGKYRSMDWFKGKITGTPSYFMGKSMVYYGFL
jgi:hypothetical protein